MQLRNRSRISARSIVAAMLIAALPPSGSDELVLGRRGRRRDQLARPVVDQPVEAELARRPS